MREALAVKTEAVPEGYFRIGPYLDTGEDRAKFDRADRIHEKILDWIRRADAIPLYLTGDSSSGKSSVLNAFVLPALEKTPAGLSLRRGSGQTRKQRSTRRSSSSPPRASGSWARRRLLRDKLEALARRTDNRLLIALDQFEEFVILACAERKKAFAAFLADLRARPINGLTLLVLRSDYTTAIDELGLPLLRRGENWQEVGRFTIAAGTKFMALSRLELKQDTLDRLAVSASELDDSPGMIRPIT